MCREIVALGRQVNRTTHPRGQGPQRGCPHRRLGALARGDARQDRRGPGDQISVGPQAGAQWITQRMWERKVLAEQQEFRRRLAPPPWPFRQGRGRRKRLESVELMFIERLRDRRDPLPPDEVKVWREVIWQDEGMLGVPKGRDARLARVQWEIDQYQRRISLDGVIKAVRRARVLRRAATRAGIGAIT